MKCLCCGKDSVRWIADFKAEEYGWCDTDGTVSELHCDNCGADYVIYVPYKGNENGDKQNNNAL